MKITKTQLRRVIKEEISKAIEEGKFDNLSYYDEQLAALAKDTRAQKEKGRATMRIIGKISDDMKSLNGADQGFIAKKLKQLGDKRAGPVRYAKLLAAIKKYKDSVRGKAPIIDLIKDI